MKERKVCFRGKIDIACMLELPMWRTLGMHSGRFYLIFL